MKSFKVFTFLIIIFLISLQSHGQLQFTPQYNIPVKIDTSQLQNAWVGGINFPLWSSIDMNGDGLQDLYMFDRTNDRVLTFINNGAQSINAFHFDPQYINKFPKVPSLGWGMCVDFNCDGKMDFVMLDTLNTGLALYRNDYSVSNGLQFTLITHELKENTNTLGVQTLFATRVLIPTFIDVDNDGDMDILGFNATSQPRIAYHQNFAMENFGRCDTLDFKFVDQCWGNFALSIGSNRVSVFNDTCPPPQGPVAPSDDDYGYEIARRDDTLTTLFALDVDGDGLKDLLIGDIASPNSLLVHNGGTLQVANADSEDIWFPSYDMPIKIFDFVYHAYIDVDNDGKNDLIASAGQIRDKNQIWLYKNTGTTQSPVFNMQVTDFMQGEMIDEGEAAAPVLFDYDADGLKDLVIAHTVFFPQDTALHCGLSVYKNIGTPSSPSFEFITDDYAGIYTYGLPNPINASFGDMDGNGSQDLIIGDGNGFLHYFKNTAPAGFPASFPAITPNYMTIDVGNNAAPQITDMNNDGRPDLIVGSHRGTVKYFQNTGTSSSAFFSKTATTDTLGGVNVKLPGFINGYSAPFVFNCNNQRRMLVGNMNGDIFLYGNIDNNLSGTFTRLDTILSGELGIRTSGMNLTVSGGDLNGDGLTDMLVGMFSGGMQAFYGIGCLVGISEIEQENLFECFPNPAKESFTVRMLRDADSKYRFRMFNVLGEMILEKNNIGPVSTFNTGSLPAGFYCIEVSTSDLSGKSFFQKIIVSH